MTLGGLTFSAKSYANIVGANERFAMAVMGTNGRGAGMAGNFQRIKDVEHNALGKGMNPVKQAGGAILKQKRIFARYLKTKILTPYWLPLPTIGMPRPPSWLARRENMFMWKNHVAIVREKAN
ncbi:MAG: hypothetical protein LBF62_02030 [Tannerellaceae bacterium]|jgi:hypothetical protein|nr:hypothetical protein [Tannerellaceae bacterium]